MPQLDLSRISYDIANEMQWLLQEEIYKNVYAKYQPRGYKRTGALQRSVTVGEGKSFGNTQMFYLYFDEDIFREYGGGNVFEPLHHRNFPDDYHHTTMYGWSAMGKNRGDFIYTPQFVNEGYHYQFARVDKAPPHFMEETMAQAENILDSYFRQHRTSEYLLRDVFKHYNQLINEYSDATYKLLFKKQ